MTGGSMVQSPEQAMRFLRYRKPGESYLQTMARIQNPAEMIPAEMKYASTVTGGNKELMEMQLTGMYGGNMTPQQIQALQASSGMLISGQTGRQARGWGRDMAGGASGIYSTFQQDILAPMGPKAVGLLSDLNQATLKLFEVATGISATLQGMAAKVKEKADSTN
jgi:hypothetical protein